MKITIQTREVQNQIEIDDDSTAEEVVRILAGMIITVTYHRLSVVEALQNISKELK